MRVEFQHQGSPHIHGLAWIRNTPKLAVSSDKEICAYIDKIIACSSNVPGDEHEYFKLQKQTFQNMLEKK